MPSLSSDLQALCEELDAIDSSSIKGQQQMAVVLTSKLQEIHGDRARQVMFRNPAFLSDGAYRHFSHVVCDVGDPAAEEAVMFTGHYDTVQRKWPKGLARGKEPITRKYDMLGDLAAAIVASKYWKLPPRRRARLLFVADEEIWSTGTEDALYSDDQHASLLQDIDYVVTGEIPVGAKKGDSPSLYIGRPGRVVLKANVRGKKVHAGDACDEDFDSYTFPRVAAAHERVWHMSFPSNDRRSILPPTRARVTRASAQETEDESMSLPGEGKLRIEVHNSNYNLTPEAICDLVRQEMHAALGDHDFDVELVKRPTRCVPPYEEDLEGSFVQNMLHIARRHTYQESGLHREITWKVGKATADEGRYGKPTVYFPPLGGNEHRHDEWIDMASLLEVVKFKIAVAEHPRHLLRVHKA